jgi:phage/plasmid-like protein (TIGR03299 family)
MSHEIQTIAFINNEPWHGLGNRLTPNQSIERWQHQAGMDWQIKEAPVLFNAEQGEGSLLNLRSNADSKVLYRSDNLEPLSVVSKRYQTVQPKEVLEFYRDLVAAGGFQLETAGVLKGGRKLWALAKTGQETMLKGGDKVKAYLLLATSCDGSLATTAQFTSIRVVCNNTLQLAVADSKGAVKVPHSTRFDPILVKQELGLGLSAWDKFNESIHLLAERKVNKFETMNFLVDVLGDPSLPLHEQPNQKAIQNVYHLFGGAGKGSDMASANGTAWGLLNGITEHVDSHRRAMSQDHRLDSAWFGLGAQIKAKAFESAMAFAA